MFLVYPKTQDYHQCTPCILPNVVMISVSVDEDLEESLEQFQLAENTRFVNTVVKISDGR